MKVYIVLLEDTTDVEGTSSEILSVHRKREKAEKVLADKKKEALQMYKEKIPNPDNNVKIAEDVPGYFHIYDEYSDNSTEISITEKELED